MRLFLAVETQWMFAGTMGVPMGLDYRAVEAAMNMMRVPVPERPDLFARLRLMEAAAGATLRKRLKR